MALQATRRQFLTGIGLAGTVGTALLTPGRHSGSPDLARTIPADTWPVPGHDPARTKHAPEATPPTTDAKVAWTARVDVTPWTPTVTVDEETVYVQEPKGLTALDRSDGTERWRLDVGNYWPQAGYESTVGPLVVGDRVILGSRVDLLGVDAASGSLEWVRAVDSAPRPAVVVGEVVFYRDHTDDGGLVAVDVETGGLWRRWQTDEFWVPVALVDDRLVTYDGGHVATFHPRTGDRLWLTETPGPPCLGRSMKAITGGDHVIVGSDPLVALNGNDGTEAWRYGVSTGDDGEETFQPATDGARVFVASRTAEETIAFDARTGAVVWRVDRHLGEPVVANETVYCFDEDGITALDANNGRRLGRFGTDLLTTWGVAETLTVAGDRLYAAFSPETDDEGPTVFALEAQ